MDLPPLRSLAIYDGIPPQEEGEDPKVLYYYPDVSADTKFNEVGLYLTFLGFCRDFRSSEDCQYFETETLFTCFANVGGTNYAAATFDVSRPGVTRSPRVLLASMRTFAALYQMLFRANESLSAGDIQDLQKVFTVPPFLSKLPPATSLWLLCEEALAESIQTFHHVRGGAFLFDDMLLHTSIDPRDVSAIYIAHKAQVSKFCWRPRAQFSASELAWAVGGWPDGTDSSQGPPRLELRGEPLYLVMLKRGELSILVLVLEPVQLNLHEFSGLLNAFGAISTKIYNECKRYVKSEPGGAEIFRAEGQWALAKPIKSNGRFADRDRTDCFLRFIGEQKLAFARAVVQVGGPVGCVFMEQFAEQATLVSVPQTSEKSLVTSVQDCLRELKRAKLVC
jgi:hypothetical protein